MAQFDRLSTSLALPLNAFIPSVFKSEHGSSPHFDLQHDTIAVRLRIAPSQDRPSSIFLASATRLLHRTRMTRSSSSPSPYPRARCPQRLAHRHCHAIRGLAAHSVSPPTSSPYRLALADSQ
ncbi:hypothetical protein F5148DRAFT_1285262 [Russula earlei]|uniref:Uncharacterized protein n=1 Tax=Russula earlei TaxID=71964 RepID=A0ACC0U6Z4_9AGAM|nr:hypothetical protein F5148DRAFT_1285262 [Russula earlei]